MLDEPADRLREFVLDKIAAANARVGGLMLAFLGASSTTSSPGGRRATAR